MRDGSRATPEALRQRPRRERAHDAPSKPARVELQWLSCCVAAITRRATAACWENRCDKTSRHHDVMTHDPRAQHLLRLDHATSSHSTDQIACSRTDAASCLSLLSLVSVVVCARDCAARRGWRQACLAARSRAVARLVGSCGRLSTFARDFCALRCYGPVHPAIRTYTLSVTLLQLRRDVRASE